MRHFRTFTVFSFLALGLSACGVDDTGPTAFNPATNIDVMLSSFTMKEVPPQHTSLFSDLLKKLEPAPSEDESAHELAAAIRAQLALFLGLKYSTEPEWELISFRNPLDLLRREIGADAVANFTDAKRYISSRIDDAQPGEYSNTSKGVYIRFTSQEASEETDASITDYQWRYPILKWVYTPDTSNRVTRVINWVATGEFPEGSTRPSATLGTQFYPRDFGRTGYNDGARLHSEGSIVIEGEREMAFTREYASPETDIINIDGTKIGTSDDTTGGPEFSFAGSDIDCLKVQMNYDTSSVDIYTSLNKAPTSDDYCFKLSTPTESYSVKSASRR
jgi:hypothetical protein